MTPTNAPPIYTNTTLYRAYIYRRHLRRTHESLHQVFNRS